MAAARDDTRTLGATDFHVAHDFLVLLSVHDRARVGRLIVWLPRPECGDARGERLNERVVDRSMDEKARCRTARLTLPRKVHATQCRSDRAVDVGIWKDHQRILAAEFEGDCLDLSLIHI